MLAMLLLLLLVVMVVSNVELGVPEMKHIAIKNCRPYCKKTDLLFPPAPFELLLVALGVLLLCPLEFDVESGMSSEGSSHPWQDFFVLESGENTAFITRDSIILVIKRIYRELCHSNNVKLTTRLAVVVAL